MTNEDFFPKGYEVPKAPSNYMKLEDGQNKLRILSAPLMGFIYWNAEGKPVRLPMDKQPQEIPSDIREGDKVKHFWALAVWNYTDKRVQILELTQSSIQGPIQDLVENEDWGNPTAYDITITKKGQKLDTEYTVMPSAPKPVPVEAEQAYKSMRINLPALLEGGDPFPRE